MPNDIISPVSRIEMNPAGQAPIQGVQNYPAENPFQAADAAKQQQQVQVQVQTQAKVHSHPQEQSQPDPKTAVSSSKRSDVHMMFRVDPKTREVSVLMVDKATKKVVRTIPPEEIKKMNAGDLVELLA